MNGAAGKQVRWERSRDGDGSYCLEVGGVEWVRFRRERGRGTLANVRTSWVGWTIELEGCMRPRVAIRRAGSNRDLAIFTPTSTGLGLLEFHDKRVYHWLPLRPLDSQWAFCRPGGEILVRLGGTPPRCWIFVAPAARSEEEGALLAALGLYLIQMMVAHAASITASTLAATTTV